MENLSFKREDLIGKLVINQDAKILGKVKSLSLTTTGKARLIIEGQASVEEMTIFVDDIQTIRDIILLKPGVQDKVIGTSTHEWIIKAVTIDTKKNCFNKIEDAERFAEEIGYPILITPSYVKSGPAMKLIHTPKELRKYWAANVSCKYPAAIYKYANAGTTNEPC